MGPGDTVSIPTGTVHNARNIGTEPAVLMVAFSTPDRQVVGEWCPAGSEWAADPERAAGPSGQGRLERRWGHRARVAGHARLRDLHTGPDGGLGGDQLTDWTIGSPAAFIGIDNCSRLFTGDDLFWKPLGVTWYSKPRRGAADLDRRAVIPSLILMSTWALATSW